MHTCTFLIIQCFTCRFLLICSALSSALFATFGLQAQQAEADWQVFDRMTVIIKGKIKSETIFVLEGRHHLSSSSSAGIATGI